MVLKIIGSNSAGNAYVLENQNEALLIECGLPFQKVKEALNFNIRKIVGAVVTHDHGDHAGFIKQFLDSGIDTWASPGTHIAAGTNQHARARMTFGGDQFRAGSFNIAAFDVQHDAAQPLGFIIEHPDCGRTLFLTDTHFTKYTFPGLQNVIIEANYCEDIVRTKYREGGLIAKRRDRVIISHMSLQTCKKTLAANDLKKVQNIVLIHLSNEHSDARRFQKEIAELTGKCVTIADAGLNIPFTAKPF